MQIVIYSLVGCPFSRAAEDLVKSKINPNNYKIIKVQQSEKDYYKDKHSYQTFPQVFVDDVLIGGYSELRNSPIILN